MEWRSVSQQRRWSPRRLRLTAECWGVDPGQSVSTSQQQTCSHVSALWDIRCRNPFGSIRSSSQHLPSVSVCLSVEVIYNFFFFFIAEIPNLFSFSTLYKALHHFLLHQTYRLTFLDSVVFQGNGSVCIEDRTGSSDMYPSYTMFTTSQRPWLRPLLTTPTPPVSSGQYPGSVSVAKGKPDVCDSVFSCTFCNISQISFNKRMIMKVSTSAGGRRIAMSTPAVFTRGRADATGASVTSGMRATDGRHVVQVSIKKDLHTWF